MIDRYTRTEMGHLWSRKASSLHGLRSNFWPARRWLSSGNPPRAPPARMRRNARFDVRRIEKIEAKTRHDVIAFLTDVGRHLGADESTFTLV